MWYILGFLLVIHFIVSAILVLVILLQSGKGGGLSGLMGGASGSIGESLGATSAIDTLSRFTSVAATIFFITTISITFVASQLQKQTIIDKGDFAVEKTADKNADDQTTATLEQNEADEPTTGTILNQEPAVVGGLREEVEQKADDTATTTTN